MAHDKSPAHQKPTNVPRPVSHPLPPPGQPQPGVKSDPPLVERKDWEPRDGRP